MIDNKFYFQSEQSVKIKDDIINFLKERLQSNPARVRDINKDDLLQKAVEKLANNIIIDYHHAIFMIENNTIYVFQNSILDTVNNKDEFLDRLNQLQGKIFDDDGQEYDLKEFKRLKFSNVKQSNNNILESKRPNASMSYLNQFFYLSNKVSLKVAANTEKFLVHTLPDKYPDHIINMQNYVYNNLLTEFLMIFVPESLVMFGETVSSTNIPVLFNISGMWNGVNAPMFATNFINSAVPDKWGFFNTQTLIHANFSFEYLLKHVASTFFIKNKSNKNNNKEQINNLYKFYFLNRNKIDPAVTNNQLLDQKFRQEHNISQIYKHSHISIFVDGTDRYWFEIAQLSDLYDL